MSETQTATASFASTIARGCKVSMGLAEMLLKDVHPGTFARSIKLDGTRIDANHPAFVYGHLSLYPARIVSMLGGDASDITPSEHLKELFEAGKDSVDDADGTIYPSMGEITGAFFRGYERAMETVSALDDARLAEPNPVEGRLREMFPTLGGALLFVLNDHPMFHLGQVSTWRRCMGLGPVM
ncbi:MAG: DinB family protein [Phycisphaerales bacterium JB037]